MDAIKFGVFPAVSHSWHRHAESMLAVRAIKTMINGCKAFFGRYSVSLLDNVTLPLMRKCPDAIFANFLRKPLSSYNISIPCVCRDQVQYVSDKVGKLCKAGREVEVKINFTAAGVEAIPMYYSQNAPSKNLANTVGRSNECPDQPGSDKIRQSHLSYAYAKGLFGRGKESFLSIETAEGMRATHATVPDIPFSEHPYKEGFYFSPDKFSEAVEALVTKHWNIPDGSEKNYIVSVTHGFLALRLKKSGGCMKAVVYDPNDTLRHKTIILSSPSAARHLEIDDFSSRNCRSGCIFSVDFFDNLDVSSDRIQDSTDDSAKPSDWLADKLEQCDVRIFGDPDVREFVVNSACSGQFMCRKIQDYYKKKVIEAGVTAATRAAIVSQEQLQEIVQDLEQRLLSHRDVKPH